MESRRNSSVNVVLEWIEKQSRGVKILIGVAFVVLVLVAFKLCLRDEFHFLYFVSQLAHIEGMIALIYKLIKKKTCSGLSLKSQEVTAISLAVKICCSFSFPHYLLAVLDLAVLVPTIWVIYMIRYKLKSTYVKDHDDMALKKLVIPAAVLAILVRPRSTDYIHTIPWAFWIYLESVSVLPQLRLIQNAKMVEPFTAHYLFALGVTRILGCAFWIIMLIESHGEYLFFFGNGSLWTLMNFIAAIVQTFILVDFCYYYVKSIIAGQLSVLPLPV
ncbi:hypothetical protein AQUCO_05800215v1 [Aquilegia coerulea]|uniref:ER lumen protein-retaining receptor n=1 Tax=Aquilegia coerulea TaxID=218851 RepID=A0A2G5CFD2_AQUCA|nr:hypothetical protein AQUCO_05800215v1 [Aquilegia coerulea]